MSRKSSSSGFALGFFEELMPRRSWRERLFSLPWRPILARAMQKFKPQVFEIESVQCTIMQLEDTSISYQPLVQGKPHFVDLGYDSSGKLVAIKVWGLVQNRRAPFKLCSYPPAEED